MERRRRIHTSTFLQYAIHPGSAMGLAYLANYYPSRPTYPDSTGKLQLTPSHTVIKIFTGISQAGCSQVPTTGHTITTTEATYTSTITDAPANGILTVYTGDDGYQSTWGMSTFYEVYIYTTTQQVDLVGSGIACGVSWAVKTGEAEYAGPASVLAEATPNEAAPIHSEAAPSPAAAPAAQVEARPVEAAPAPPVEAAHSIEAALRVEASASQALSASPAEASPTPASSASPAAPASAVSIEVSPSSAVIASPVPASVAAPSAALAAPSAESAASPVPASKASPIPSSAATPAPAPKASQGPAALSASSYVA
jgi:hypothetical protein